MEKKLEAFLNMSLDQVFSDRFGRYSKYVIQGRALPDARDGLKPVQRRILFSMSELGLNPNTPYKKSARVVGDVIGKYHPHGDSSIYEAMVRMAQDWKMNTPLIDMHGNKGSIDDDPAAAMRYTEARLAKAAQAIINNIKKNTVSFAPNFDDSEKEPTVMPGLFPNLLVNGAKGIAAGYATEMPPHNLGEVVDAIIYRIQKPNCQIDDLTKIVKGPDFPTGAIVQGIEGIKQAFATGQGKMIIRSKYGINNSKTAHSITITEIPYGVVKQKLVRDIDEIRFNKTIDGIKEVRDESDRNGISIYIEIELAAEVQPIINYLLAKTEMQIYYNYNNIAIYNRGPKQMGLIDLIDAYLEHQRDVQIKAIKYDLEKDLIRLEIVQGFIKVSTIADQVIDTIRKAEGSKQGVVKALIETYAFTELQANAIAELRLYRLSRTDQTIYITEAAELQLRINRFKLLLENEKEFNTYLIEILKNMRQDFAVPRRTVIESEMTRIEIKMDELIRHDDAYIGISRQGYIKRLSPKVAEGSELKDYNLKPEDTIVYWHKINTSDKLLIFTDKGRFVFVPAHSITESKWKEVGKHINDFAAIDADENVIDAIAVNDFKLNMNLALVTSSGKIKRTKIADFEISRFSKPSQAFILKDDDKLVAVRPTNGLMDLIVITTNGKATKYHESQVPIQGAKSSGVIGIILSPGATVTTLVAANSTDVIGLISKRGGAKRMKASAIVPSSRNTPGRQVFKEIKGNPHIAIDGRIVTPDTVMTFRSNFEALDLQIFKQVDYSTINEGFSLIGPAQSIDGRIIVFNRIHKDSILLQGISSETEDDRFKKAEDAIEAASQISIDDILKGL